MQEPQRLLFSFFPSLDRIINYSTENSKPKLDIYNSLVPLILEIISLGKTPGFAGGL
jgi:hypothetical protein